MRTTSRATSHDQDLKVFGDDGSPMQTKGPRPSSLCPLPCDIVRVGYRRKARARRGCDWRCGRQCLSTRRLEAGGRGEGGSACTVRQEVRREGVANRRFSTESFRRGGKQRRVQYSWIVRKFVTLARCGHGRRDELPRPAQVVRGKGERYLGDGQDIVEQRGARLGSS